VILSDSQGLFATDITNSHTGKIASQIGSYFLGKNFANPKKVLCTKQNIVYNKDKAKGKHRPRGDPK
jgi:hypothetical protein